MPVISSAIFSDWRELVISYLAQLLANLLSINEIWEHWKVSGTNLYILLSYELLVYLIKMNRTDYIHNRRK